MTGSSGFCVDHWVTVEMNCSNWLQSTFSFPAIPQWDGSQGCVTINAHPSDISECQPDDSVTNYGWVAQKSKRVREAWKVSSCRWDPHSAQSSASGSYNPTSFRSDHHVVQHWLVGCAITCLIPVFKLICLASSDCSGPLSL